MVIVFFLIYESMYLYCLERDKSQFLTPFLRVMGRTAILYSGFGCKGGSEKAVRNFTSPKPVSVLRD